MLHVRSASYHIWCIGVSQFSVTIHRLGVLKSEEHCFETFEDAIDFVIDYFNKLKELDYGC